MAAMNASSLTPALAALSEQIRLAAANGQTLHIQGGNTKAFYGDRSRRQPGDGVLSTASLPLKCDHEPTELVVTASGNLPLAQLQSVLADKGQYLPFDPPHFGDAATVGGMVAAGLSGPARSSSGSVRDYVLGVHVLDGKGDLLQFGGQVMKNVAGYDVSRLLAGSMGQLGVIVEVSLKVLPLPLADLTLVLQATQAEALRRLNAWSALPLPLNASAWLADAGDADQASGRHAPSQSPSGQLFVRLRGAQAAVASAQQRLGQEGAHAIDGSTANSLWLSLREHTHAFFALPTDTALWRISVPDTCPPLPLGASALLEWGGAQRWVKAPVSAAASLRAMAQAAGGHATLFRGAADPMPSASSVAAPVLTPVFTPLSPTLERIHRQLFAQLDPSGVWNTGRMGCVT
jgi:glycolate oxidase FAD binding subunit